MKKIFVTILAILYLSASTGATIHMHYCMGKMVAWGLWRTQDKDACAACNMDKKKGCCEDKKQSVKMESKHNFQPATFHFSKVLIDLPQYDWTNYTLITHSHQIINYPLSNSPPGTDKIPIYISNCVYRV